MTESELGKATNALGLALHQLITDANLFISPLSIHAALSMTSAGARGKTRTEMLRTLRTDATDTALGAAWGQLMGSLTDGKDAGFDVRIANRLFAQQGLTLGQRFSEITRTHYAAPVEQVDYAGRTRAAQRRVNTWVEDQTNKKIKDLIPNGAFTPDTRLTLVNAIWFLGKWSVAFDEKRTHTAPFTRKDGSKIDCDLMQREDRLGYRRLDGADLVALPYGKSKRLRMLLVVPRRPGDLDTIINGLDADRLARWTQSLGRRQMTFSMPKFKGGSKLMLAQNLRKMGMRAPFSPSADFSGITTDAPLQISDVIHQSFVDVSEKGTEAAAATAVIMKTESAMDDSLYVRADRPFFYAIQDSRSGALLFSGRLDDPSA